MMRKLRIGWVLALIAGAGWASSARAATDPVDAIITVTPVAEVSLSLDTSSYSFGSMDLNTSTNSATALRLTNIGDVSVKVDKQITIESDPSGWTASTSSGTDTYVLYCATSTSRLNLSDFTAATQFGALNNVTPLTGPLGAQPTLPPTGPEAAVDLWFRLDMPTRVTSGQSRSISVRFTGTAQ